MPTIKQYTQQVRSSGSLDVRVNPDAADTASTALARLGNTAMGAGLDIMESKEKSDLQVEVAQARADATKALQQDVQSGVVNDDNYLESYNTRISQSFDAIGGKARTRVVQDAASAQRADLMAHFDDQARTAKITADGQKIALNFDRALNASGDTLLNDPTQYQAIRDQWGLSIDDPSGPYARMSAQQRSKAKLEIDQNLAKWYVQGAIEKLGPDYATKELNSGKLDDVLGAETKDFLLRRAETEKRTRQEDISRERTLRMQQEADADKKTRLKMLQDFEKDDMGGWTFKKITTSFNDPAVAEHMRDMLKTRLANPDQTSNPAVKLDVQRRIYLPPGDPDKIMDPSVVTKLYSVNRQLSQPDTLVLLRDMEIAKSQDSLGTDLQTISSTVHATFARSPIGQVPGADLILMSDSAMYRWRQDVDKAIQAKRDAGEDPRELLNPKNKDYIAAPEKLATYLTTTQAAVATSAAGIRNPQVGQLITKDGKSYKFLGGNPRSPQAWQEVKPIDPSDAPIPSVPGT